MRFADFDELVLQIFKSQRGIYMNSNTQNTKIKSITEKTLVVGIDVGSETHYVIIQVFTDMRRECLTLESSAAA